MNPEFIREDEINQDTLSAIFKRALFKFQKVNQELFFPNTVLIIESEKTKIFISLSTNSKLIRFFSLFRFKPNLTFAKKLRFIKELNRKLMMVRFFILEMDEDMLAMDYFLSYRSGLHAYQVVKALQLYLKSVNTALYDLDENNLIQ